MEHGEMFGWFGARSGAIAILAGNVHGKWKWQLVKGAIRNSGQLYVADCNCRSCNNFRLQLCFPFIRFMAIPARLCRYYIVHSTMSLLKISHSTKSLANGPAFREFNKQILQSYVNHIFGPRITIILATFPLILSWMQLGSSFTPVSPQFIMQRQCPTSFG